MTHFAQRLLPLLSLLLLFAVPSALAAPVETGGVLDEGGPDGTLTVGIGTPGTYENTDTGLHRSAIIAGGDADGSIVVTTPNGVSIPSVEVDSLIVGRDAGVTGSMNLGHSAPTSADINIKAHCVTVGAKGAGTLVFGNETHLIQNFDSTPICWPDGPPSFASSTQPLVSVGQTSGSTGTLVVRDKGEALLTAMDWAVGLNGTGELRIESGGFATGRNLKAGLGSGEGHVIIDGVDPANPGRPSELRTSLFVDIGIGAAKGTLEVRNGGLYMGAANFSVGVTINPGPLDSRLDVNTGGTMFSGGINIFCAQALITGAESTVTAQSFQVICFKTRGAIVEGNLRIEDGAVVTVTDFANLSSRKVGDGLITVTGPGSLFDLTGDRDLTISHTDLDDTRLDGLTTVNINNGGRVQAVEAINIGNEIAVFDYPTTRVNLCTNGTLAGSSIVVNASGLLAGGGRVEGSLVNGGIVAPGCSAGILDVVGSYEQTVDGILEIEIAGDDDYDVLNVTGDTNMSGTIEMTFLDGYTPPPGATYPVIEGAGLVTLDASLNMVVTNLDVPAYGNGWSIEFVPEPSPTMLAAAALLSLAFVAASARR